MVSNTKVYSKLSKKVLDIYSQDASIFRIEPQAVVFPKNTRDLEAIVKQAMAASRRKSRITLTARGAGTCMSGGAINNSWILDFTRYFKRIGKVENSHIWVRPGTYYRKLEKYLNRRQLLMPSYPASKELCTVGGMVGNNAGGEKSLKYGKTERYVSALKVVLADGQQYEFKPLTWPQLQQKMKQHDHEGRLYSRIFHLIDNNLVTIKNARPKVSKNSTGYNLWDVWDGTTFDMTKLFVGSQGTLGIITDIQFRLVPKPKHEGLLVAFMPTMQNLGEIINTVVATNPSSFESFDDKTLGLALRFLPFFKQRIGWWGVIKLALSFIPDIPKLWRGLPKLILLVEFEGNSSSEVHDKVADLRKKLGSLGLETEDASKPNKARKYWLMRRESFNILRHKVRHKHTAPFIDDLVVNPPYLPEFLPKLRAILDKWKLEYTVAGHLGDGNFHIIPLMDLSTPSDQAKIIGVMREVNELVLHYHGSISGEHNDGLIRGSWLPKMYDERTMQLFKEVKKIFDPLEIFNPHKKTSAKWQYSWQHLNTDL